jgi:acetylornithine deacetylase/succinyl-diaminopimelate desuccinylase-like protein
MKWSVNVTTWQEVLDGRSDASLEELKDFLRIPSVSALPEHAADVRQAGFWVMARMRSAGIENVVMMETGGHPVVYGDWLHADGKPTVLIYGHFDVQPADPIELWTTPPFEPDVRDGRIYARGANDDKGNMLAPILAVEALLQSEGALPVNVKFFFEGQEEIGSPTLPDFVADNRDKFACDMIFSSDGGQWSETEPALMIGLRGLSALEIEVTGPNRDVHSGMVGGAVQNPIHALVQILDSMRGADGKILVEGFYDDVRPLTDEDRQHLATIPYDETDYLARLGLNGLYGEPGYSTMERVWARPTLEVNGIWGGFQGAGTKTVIPSTAHAKITCRLVADQDPGAVAEALQAHIEKNTPAGAQVKVTVGKNAAMPYLMPTDHPANQAVRDVLVELYGREPYYARSGGSIPVCTIFKNALGAYTANFAFALNDELQHSPNEFFRLESFYRAQAGYCMLLHRLSA